jgi:TPR repeat protein
MTIPTLWLLAAPAFAGAFEERELLKQACDRGDAPECTVLALRYRDGDGAPADATYAMKLFTKACELGDTDACVLEADAYRIGAGVARDPERAVKMFTEACTVRTLGGACRALGEIYILGDGVTRDASASHLWYEQGCEAGDAESCVGAALGTERGDAGIADPNEGRRLLARACELHHGRGCTLLGERYLYGRDGSEKNTDLAGIMYSAGCENQDPESCYRVGHMYITGKGMPRDEDTGRMYLTEACAWGNYIGCRALADALKPLNLGKAVKAAQHGCTLGDQVSCKKHKALAWRLTLAGQ